MFYQVHFLSSRTKNYSETTIITIQKYRPVRLECSSYRVSWLQRVGEGLGSHGGSRDRGGGVVAQGERRRFVWLIEWDSIVSIEGLDLLIDEIFVLQDQSSVSRAALKRCTCSRSNLTNKDLITYGRPSFGEIMFSVVFVCPHVIICETYPWCIVPYGTSRLLYRSPALPLSVQGPASTSDISWPRLHIC